MTSQPTSRFFGGLLLALLIVGIGYYFRLSIEAQQKQDAWNQHLQDTQLPLPPPGHVAIRTVAGDRPGHWRITVRCRDRYKPYLFFSMAGFHPREMKAFGGFQNLVDEYSTGRSQATHAIEVPSGGILTLDVNTQEDAAGDWNLNFRGTTSQHPQLKIAGGGTPFREMKWRLTGQDRAVVLDASQPIRLFDFVPEADIDTKSSLSGCCFHLVPKQMAKRANRLSQWKDAP